MTTTTPAAGHNLPPKLVAFQTIDDLYQTAKDFADGEPITSQEMHDTITEIREKLHAAGKEADALRIKEKKPHDDAAAAVQAEFNPYVQAKKGKVDMGKAALDDLLAAWRRRIADEKAAEARRIAEAAAAEKAKAEAAMQASRGKLAAREEAEALVASAKSLEVAAKRADKGPTGLRTVWHAEIVDEEAALDWCFARAKSEFMALVQRMAEEFVRSGAREIPGVRVYSEQVAR